jgi:hypothetical protein
MCDVPGDSPDPVGGAPSSWLVNETVHGFRAHTGSGYRLPSGITAAPEPEEWQVGSGARTGKAKPFAWTPAELAIVGPPLLEAGQSSFHPGVTGASVGLFASLGLAAKKLLVLLVAPFAALWAASRRCEPADDQGRSAAPAPMASARVPTVGSRDGRSR